MTEVPTPATRPTSVGMLGPLRHRPYRWLVGGRFVSYLGNAVAPIALAFAVLDLTGSPASLGLVVGARSLANVSLLLFGGVIADRLPRDLLLQGSSFAAAITQAVVAASVLLHFATVPFLVCLSIVNGAVAAIALPASAALTPQTVPATELRPANALLRILVNGALFGGAAVGGVVVAVVGPGWGIAADAAMYVLAGLAFSRIRLERTTAPTEHRNPLRDIREGWTEFASRSWVWVIVLQFMVVNACLAGGINVLGPSIADDTFGRSSWGFILAAQTAGLVLGGFLALRWHPKHALRVGVLLTLVEAVPLLVLGNAPHVLVLMTAMLVAGVAMEQFGVAWDVSLQEHIPQDRLARVYSYDMVGSFVAIPLGQIVVGPLAEAWGTERTLTGAAALVTVATLLALCSNDVRQLQRRPSAP